jgi:hypothetical protein
VSEHQRLYEHLCTIVQDGRAAHPNDTTSIVADDGYERIVSTLRPLTAAIRAWLDDTYAHATPFEQIETLVDFLDPQLSQGRNDDGLFEHCGCCAHSRRSGCGGENCPCAAEAAS